MLLLDVRDPDREKTPPEIGDSGNHTHGCQSFRGLWEGSWSFGDSRTTRATASWPKNSSTFCTSSFLLLQLAMTLFCSSTRCCMTIFSFAISSSYCLMR